MDSIEIILNAESSFDVPNLAQGYRSVVLNEDGILY